jgi:hypothetical protein
MWLLIEPQEAETIDDNTQYIVYKCTVANKVYLYIVMEFCSTFLSYM